MKWKYPTGSIVYSSPAIVNGVAYFGRVDGNIYAVGNEPVTGSISISSNPSGAQIWIDGDLQSSGTPHTFDGIMAGTHTVKVHFGGYLEAENTNVVVNSGQTTLVEFQLATILKPGSLEVKSSPSHAKIYINGIYTEQVTKWKFNDMAPRDYDVYVMLEGYKTPKTEKVTVVSGKTKKLDFKLDKVKKVK